jgi:HEAT repeat protein
MGCCLWSDECNLALIQGEILEFISAQLIKSKTVISRSVFKASDRVLSKVTVEGAHSLLLGVDKLLLRQPEAVIETLHGLFLTLNEDVVKGIVSKTLDLMVNPFLSSNEKVRKDATNFMKYLIQNAEEDVAHKWINAIAAKTLTPETRIMIYEILQLGHSKSAVHALLAYSPKEITETGSVVLMRSLVSHFAKLSAKEREAGLKTICDAIAGNGYLKKASILSLNQVKWSELTLEECTKVGNCVETLLKQNDLLKHIGNRDSIGVDELMVMLNLSVHLNLQVESDKFLFDRFVHRTSPDGQEALCRFLIRNLNTKYGSIFTWMIMNGDRLIILKFCKHIREEIVRDNSVLACVSEMFLNGIQPILEQQTLGVSIWGDKPPRSSQYFSTRIVNALFQIIPNDMTDMVLVKSVLMDWFVVCAHPAMIVNQGDDLWVRLVYKVGITPSIIEEYHSYADKWLLLESNGRFGGLQSNGGFKEATLKSIRLAFEISPRLIFKKILSFATEIVESEEFINLTNDHVLIWNTPAEELCFDPLFKKELSTKGMNKDQKWELEMKKELEKKGTIKRTKQELELIQTQFKKEKEIREYVQMLKDRLNAVMEVLHEVLDVCLKHVECKAILKDFVPYILDLLLYHIIKRECVSIRNGRDIETSGAISDGRAIQLFTKLLEIYLQESTLNHLLVANTILSTFGVDDVWLEDKYNLPLERLVKQISEELHDEEDLHLLDTAGFTVIFPMIQHVIMKEGRVPLVKEKQYTEMIMSCSDFLLAHIAFEGALYLPRQKMVDCLLRLIKDYPRLRVAGRDGLLALCVTLSHFNAENSTEEEKILTDISKTLLEGILFDEAAVRSSCIAALSHIPLLEALMDRYNVILWIGQFDEDDNTQAEAQELWNDLYGDEGIETNLVPNLVTFVIHSNRATRISAGKAVCSALETDPNLLDEVLDTIFNYYRIYMKDPVPELDAYGMVTPESLNRPDPFEQRSGVAMTIQSCVSVISEKVHVMSVFTFLIEENALGDRNQFVQQQMLQSGLELLEKQGKPFIKDLLDLFDTTLSSLNSEQDKVREAVVVLMGSLARYLEATDQRIVETVIKLIDTLKTPSQDVQIAVAECLPALVKINKDHIGGRIADLLDMLFKSENRGHRRGAAYGLAGIVKGSGVASLKDHLIMAHLKEAIEDKRNIQKKEGALFAFETLSFMLGRMFEPYVIQILPLLLVCYGDSNKNIRDATEDTCRVIMSKLSAHCVKLLLPSLLNGLHERSFKTKVGAIEIMASMSALAPKQLGQSLPTIVPKICEALSDSHQKVQEAAREALEQFGKVIKNPEIHGLVPVLIAALVNPNHKTLPALAELLDTTFIHYIDAPSLALLVPIIYRGLKERSAETKKKAAQIMGNMASLTEPSDLTPYLETLVPPLKEVLIDPVPDARATAAKAFGGMIAKLGEDKFPGLVTELLQKLESDTGGVDRNGAAQGLSEVLAGIGLARMEDLLPHIINQANSVKAFAREGFTTLLVYLPHTFGERFTPYISKIVPTMLEGLADEIETVREAALHLGQVIVRNYFKSAVTLVLPELEQGLFNENWRIRQNSCQLIGDLIFKITGISQQATSDENDENEGFGTEHHRVALKSALGDRYESILASLYIVRSDSSGLVRNTSLGVWKAIVANTPKTLKQILPALMNILLGSLASNSYEKRTGAARTLGDLVKRLGDNILNLIIPTFEDGLESEYEDTREGVCIGLCEVMSSGGKLVETDFLFRCTPLVRKALVDESPDVRSAAAQAFDTLHQLIGPKAIDDIIPNLLTSLKKQSSSFALEGLKEIMNVRSNAVFPVLIPTLLIKPISSANAQALSTLISVAGSALTKRLDTIIPALMNELQHESDAADDILSALEVIMTSVEGDGLFKVTSILKDILEDGSLNQKITACKCLGLFFAGPDEEVDGYITEFISIMIYGLADSSLLLVKESWTALDTIVKRIRKDDMHRYVSSVRKGVRSAEQTLNPGDEISGFNLPKVWIINLGVESDRFNIASRSHDR